MSEQMLPFNDEAKIFSPLVNTLAQNSHLSTRTQGHAKGTGWLRLPSLLEGFQCLSALGGNKAVSLEEPRLGKALWQRAEPPRQPWSCMLPLMGLPAQRLQFLSLHLSSP